MSEGNIENHPVKITGQSAEFYIREKSNKAKGWLADQLSGGKYYSRTVAQGSRKRIGSRISNIPQEQFEECKPKPPKPSLKEKLARKRAEHVAALKAQGLLAVFDDESPQK